MQIKTNARFGGTIRIKGMDVQIGQPVNGKTNFRHHLTRHIRRKLGRGGVSGGRRQGVIGGIAVFRHCNIVGHSAGGRIHNAQPAVIAGRVINGRRGPGDMRVGARYRQAVRVKNLDKKRAVFTGALKPLGATMVLKITGWTCGRSRELMDISTNL